MSTIKYMEQVIGEKGRRPDSARSAPSNLAKLQAF